MIETDAPTDNRGKGERFSPTDLVCTALATCMITVMGIKARAMGFDLTDVKIEVLKILPNTAQTATAAKLISWRYKHLNK